MKNPRTLRTLLLPGLIVTTLLIAASLRFTSLPQGLAIEPGGLPAAGIPKPKGKVFYVSSAGNDGWSGKLAEPNSAKTDGPFATLAQARDAIRAMHAGKPLHQPVTVYVRAGVYTLSAPLVFSPADSGAAKCRVTYAAYPGEKVVLSGGRTITGWTQAAEGVQGNPLWTAEVRGVKEGEWYFHQLFVNGQRRQRARSPNTGFYHSDGDIPVGDTTTFKFHPGDIHASYAEQGDVEVMALEKWFSFRLPIKAVDPATNTVTLAGLRRHKYVDNDGRYWVENSPDALDAPGEWYLDRRSGMLSYLALPGEDVSHAQFVAPFLTELIRIEGSEETSEFVHDIVLHGLDFAHVDWALPPQGITDNQAAANIPAAVELIAARQCRIEQCNFVHLGQYALEVHKGSQDDQVTGNEMTDLGAGGVKVGELKPYSAQTVTTSGIQVSENYIHDIGIVYPAAVGVIIGQSGGNTVAHNEISDTNYTAISLGWTWGYGPSGAHDNIIEYNNMYNIGRGVLSDMGCIYSLGVQPGSVERYNLCHDVTRYEKGYGGWGIYTDEGSSQILIENNVVYRTQDAGFHQHYGRENILRNNIFALGQVTQIRRTRLEDHQSFSIEHNIFYWKEGTLLDGRWSDNNFHLDSNLYWQAAGQPIQFRVISDSIKSEGHPEVTEVPLAAWQKQGQDVHSLIADPLFADPEHGDFMLKPGSPAAKIGFQPIDLSHVGRTK